MARYLGYGRVFNRYVEHPRTYVTDADLLLAVIIGSSPAFAILFNAFRSKTSYDSRGYRKQADNNADKQGGSKVELKAIGSRGGRGRGVGLGTTDSHWAGAHSSQEELRTKHDGIMVSTTTTITHTEDSADVFDGR